MQQNLRLISIRMLFFIAVILLGACSSLKFPGVYKIGILQGNIIDQKKVNQLEKGMTKLQVQFVMGTALVNDVFNRDRWDYIYNLRRGDETIREKRFTVFFEDGKLSRWEGDVAPKAETEDNSEEYLLEDADKLKGG